MTSTLAPSAGALLEGAAAAVTGALTIGEPVTLVETESIETFTAAIFVPFGGRVSGEFAIFVDAELGAVLAAGPGADLTAALAPAVDAVVTALGTVAPGVAQSVEPRLARTRIDGFDNSGMVALQGAQGARAAIALGLRAEPADAGATAPAASQPVPAERLDLLRGVEMQASAELGRAQMTVNQLLSLRPGAVVELDRAAGDPADLYVNGRLMARGEVVVVDENYALRITHIVGDDSTR
ncbi:flagellar motor switch protein FliN [uncultured Jatrophihabitans sp.]|uniref:flagellar motor switch protein FliN n=1 Tax=uncultured Jatrophihabitans sp. TaxID=1610747 RepID=UPI0035CC1FA2